MIHNRPRLQTPVRVVVLLLAIIAFAGCGQSTTPAPSAAPSSAAPAASPAPASPSAQASAKPAAANTPDAKAREAALYEAAKKEGQLKYYGTMEAGDAKALITAFEKRYSGITVEHFRAAPAELREKTITEFRAGRYEADLYGVGIADLYLMQKEGMLRKHTWPGAASYPRDRLDPDGYWIGTRNMIMVPAYNTKLVSAAEAPKTWDDLLDPRWQGKLGLEQEVIGTYFFSSILLDRGTEKGMEFMRKLAAQKPQLRNGQTNLNQMLVAGEFSVAAEAFPYHIEDSKDRGAPVEWVKVSPAYSSGVLGLSIAARAPHPNAAQLWAEWETSDEGQRVQAQIGRPPAKPDVPNLDSRMQAMASLKTISLPPAWAQDEEKWRAQFRDLFWPKKN